MLTIKIGNRRIKLLNWLIFIAFIVLIVYLLFSLIYLLPIFSKTYNYNLKKENYELKEKTIFKNAHLKCNVKEIYVLDASDNLVKSAINKDLIEDGFKKKGNSYVRKTNSFGTCKKERKTYLKEHKKNYVSYKLNGNKKDIIIYGNKYDDKYVSAKINNKSVNDISVQSNLNEKKVGSYIITYTLNISKYYKQKLYRKVLVVDNEKPNITLEGDKEITLDYGKTYIEPGFKASDNYDGNVTNKVFVINKVNTKKPGTYKITYKVKDSSNNTVKEYRTVIVKEKDEKVSREEPKIEEKDGLTYVNGILLVNKTHSLPKDYDPKVNKKALESLKKMQADAKAIGLNLPLVSGYRSYKTQEQLYNKYVKKDGEEQANTYSAKPGHSEHQTGLAFDIGSVDRSFQNTNEAKWIEQNCHLYGFIVRYPKDKTNITGYIYEPWHVRYLGIDVATKVKESNLTLEEYLGVN